ncbi:MAG: HAD-IC family P-type ATPase [bacterium]|nr:HAD-IC family P-type ATPase [bacterium]
MVQTEAKTETKSSRQLSRKSWHAFPVEEVQQELRSSAVGLSSEEAERRLAEYGPNALPVKKPPTVWAILLQQLLHPLIFILFAAVLISLLIGETVDSLFILIVIAINSGLGTYQEYQAEKSAAGLQKLLKVRARVRRDGKEVEIPAEEVVPGDIILLESGNKVPADLRLIEVQSLTADESFLTGESMAAEKKLDTLPEETLVSDRSNMSFAGSTLTSGRGSGIVIATGEDTQVGHIARTVTESESGKPPLLVRMERFVKHISILVLLISLGLALLLWSQGYDLSSIFFLVVALAVSTIPEGLPVALTVALSIASKRMSERNVIVRKLTAVESLGSCTVIASDKTGTLTVNQQTVRSVLLPDGRSFEFSGEGYKGEGEVRAAAETNTAPADSAQLKRLAELAVLANEGSLEEEDGNWRHRGDAIDVAFLAMAYKLGLKPQAVREHKPITREIPYESELKYSAVYFEEDGAGHVAAKGAAETILDFCDRMTDAETPVELDRAAVMDQVEHLAAQGLRVLAVAGAETPSSGSKADAEEAHPSGLIFYGLVGFIDPLRPEAIESVQKCKEAGIQVMMITGDHPATADAIARELGLSDKDEPVVTGAELSEVGGPESPEFEQLVASTHVFARVSPTQKLEIVDVLIRRGEFVAVTGDGVNDAPALRRANIGVAMGSGTDVAKEVGSMIVADDNFASIVAGVEEGRFAYDNVRKVAYLLISVGAAEVLMFMTAVIMGMPIPLLAVQLLWLNLVTNGIQDVALAFEDGEPGAMQRKPRRPEESIFNAQMIRQTVVSGFTIGAIAFVLWYWLVSVQGMEEGVARNIVLLFMVLSQNVHVFNCRSESVSAFKIPLRRNLILLGGVVAAQAIHIGSMYLPFMQNILGIGPVGLNQWAMLLALALVILVVMEVFKLVQKKA